MIPPTFWTTQNQTPERPVLPGTPGDALANPMTLLTGLSADGRRNPQLSLDDKALFPRYDGVTNLLPSRPADFAVPTLKSFMGWHAYHQIEYLREHGADTDVTDGADTLTAKVASIGSSSDPGGPMHVLLSQDGQRALVLNRLSLTDIAALPLADQRVLAGLPQFQGLAAALGLLPNATVTSATEARNQMIALVQERIDVIEATSSFQAGRQGDFDADPSVRGDLYHYLFTGQLRMMIDRLNTMGIFHPDTITAALNEVLDRFQRLERFMAVTDEASGFSFDRGVNTLDGLASIKSAQNILKGVELRLFDLAQSAREVVVSGTYQGRPVDTPDMVFLLQTFENYANEAEAEGKAEEMQQVNAVLRDYTHFQKMLNETLKTFDPVALADPDTTERKGIRGYGLLDSSVFSVIDRKSIAMFDSVLAPNTGANSFHPIEVAIGVTRPTERLVLGGSIFQQHPKANWDALAINIAEATKMLNQDSQIRMDEVSRLNKQKNRNYDLASNTLNKMSDILRSIIN